MENTEQFNIRLPKSLIYDLEYISQQLKVNRNEWIRLNLAKIIKNNKEEIIGEFEKKYVQGLLNDKEFKELVGFNPSEGMKELKNNHLDNKKKGKENFREYVNNIIRDLDSSEKPYTDKYIEGIISKIEGNRKVYEKPNKKRKK